MTGGSERRDGHPSSMPSTFLGLPEYAVAVRSFSALFLAGFAFVHSLPAETAVFVAPDDAQILYSGRRDDSKPAEVRLGYSGARARLAFEGSAVSAKLESAKPNYMNVYVDGKRTEKLTIEGPEKSYPLASGLTPGVHTVELVKATEGLVGPVIFRGFELPGGAKVVDWPNPETRKIEFVGDSITCGYGIEVNDPKIHFSPDTENFCDAYAWLAARALKADYLVVARSGIGMLRNYGGPVDGSPDNMPAIYDRVLFHEAQPSWDPARFVPDVVCVNLGTNDFGGAGPNLEKFTGTYIAFVNKLIERYPEAKIVLLAGPMNNSLTLKDTLEQVMETVNAQHPDKVSFFELSKQGRHGFGADYHPSQAQGKINGAELAGYLSKLMGWPLEGEAN
jgi:lysophospholipase L1-like esterase